MARKTVLLPLGPAEGKTGVERLQQAGLVVQASDGEVQITNVIFNSKAEQAGIDFGWTIEAVEVPNEQPPKELFYIPALLLLGGVYFVQRRRRPAPPERAAKPA